MRKLVLAGAIVLPALWGLLICGYFLNRDWAALIPAFRRCGQVTKAGGDLRAITVAFDLDRVYRLNCFADGVGLGLCALIAAIGIHGLCCSASPQANCGCGRIRKAGERP